MKMRIYFGLLIAMLALGCSARAADALTQNLQRGLYEEEANHNLDAAIKAYQSVISQSEEQRKVVATALFRLGECYRKLGKTNEAFAQYKRILRDFSEQEQLVKLSQDQVGSALAAKEPSGQASWDPEAKEIARIKALLKDSPDLVNSRMYNDDRPLDLAAANGWVALGEFLLANGANLNLEGINRWTPLHRAVLAGHRAMVELLLARGADLNRRDSAQNTALHHAVTKGFKGIVELLLRNKADINAFNQEGDQPLHVAAKNGFATICEVLLDHGASISQFSKRYQWTPLHEAAQKGNREVIELFLRRKADVNSRDADGATPLRYAAKASHIETIKILLAAGADPNTQTKNGESQLFGLSNTEVIDLLLKHKANPNLKTVTGVSPLSYLISVSPPPLDAIELLLKSGADPNIQNDRGIPLLYAVINGGQGTFERVIELLLDHGADPNVQIEGQTPVSLAKARVAAHKANPEYSATWERVEKILLAHGANENLQRLSTISYRRPGWTTTAVVFTRGTNDFNRYTLFEFFAMVWAKQGPQPVLPFADLAHITISRLDPKGAASSELQVNLEEIVNAGDCAKDIPLHWGDQISVPERDHPLNAQWKRPPVKLCTLLEKCMAREVKIVVKQETNTVKLVSCMDECAGDPEGADASSQVESLYLSAPVFVSNPGAAYASGEVQSLGLSEPVFFVNGVGARASDPKPEKIVCGLRLKEVVYRANILRASSDVTRVRVRRLNPENKQQQEWTFDLTNIDGNPSAGIPARAVRPLPGQSSAPRLSTTFSGISSREVNTLPGTPIPAPHDLWLRNGDVIEIPEKQ